MESAFGAVLGTVVFEAAAIWQQAKRARMRTRVFFMGSPGFYGRRILAEIRPRQALPIDDLPLAPTVRRRLEGGPAAQGAEAVPCEEAAGRLVGLVDHGAHAGELAGAGLGEEPFHQARSHGPAA